MYLVPIAWLYVVLMMCVAEATSSNGTLLGAFFTFILYGALPISLVLYIMGTPARKRALRAKAAAAEAAHTSPLLDTPPSLQPNTSHLTPTDVVPPVREET